MTKEDARLSRKEMEKEARKQDILDVAARLFSTKEYHEVKVDDIAAQVGLSKGTIYLYYETKEKLFYSIILERTKTLVTQLRTAVQSETDFEAALQALVETYFGYFKNNEAFFKLMQSRKSLVEREDHYKLHDQARAAYRESFQLIIELMEQGRAQKLIVRADARDAAKMLWGMLHAFTFHRIMFAETIPDDVNEVTTIIQLFLHGVIH